MDIQALPTVEFDILEPRIEEAATLMSMLSQPVRLKILCKLVDTELNVNALCLETGLSQPAMSHHLKKLRDAGLVKTKRNAQTIYYSLNGHEVQSVLTILHELYCSNQ